MMKKFLPLIILLIPVFLCGCSASGGSQNSGKFSQSIEIKPASPVTTPTHEERAENTGSLLNSAQDSLNKMNEMAEKESAPEEGVKAAEAVNEEYKSRLEELAEADLLSYSDDELIELSLEISNIITAIRQARDLLQ